jgi:hypothetical protein
LRNTRMELKKLDNSHDLLITNHGHEILYANDVPVAGFWPTIGYFREKTAESTKQINDYLKGKKWTALTSKMIDNMGFIIAEEAGLTEY